MRDGTTFLSALRRADDAGACMHLLVWSKTRAATQHHLFHCCTLLLKQECRRAACIQRDTVCVVFPLVWRWRITHTAAVPLVCTSHAGLCSVDYRDQIPGGVYMVHEMREHMCGWKRSPQGVRPGKGAALQETNQVHSFVDLHPGRLVLVGVMLRAMEMPSFLVFFFAAPSRSFVWSCLRWFPRFASVRLSLEKPCAQNSLGAVREQSLSSK